MAKISLSSIYEDPKEHRHVVFETLRNSGHHALPMEVSIATDPRPVEQGFKDREQAALYVGLFVFRYGSVLPAAHDNPKGLLSTELEFRRAEALCKPCLIFVVKNTMPGASWFTAAHTSEDKGQQKWTTNPSP